MRQWLGESSSEIMVLKNLTPGTFEWDYFEVLSAGEIFTSIYAQHS